MIYSQITPSKNEIERWRAQVRVAALSSWRNDLSIGRLRWKPFLRAIIHDWEGWMASGPMNLTFRGTQILTGHGCFADYLTRIRATNSDVCAESKEGRDSAIHILMECKAFDRQREELSAEICNSINHETIVFAMIDGETSSSAMRNFCESVISIKEERERECEKTDPDRKARKIRRKKAKWDKNQRRNSG